MAEFLRIQLQVLPGGLGDFLDGHAGVTAPPHPPEAWGTTLDTFRVNGKRTSLAQTVLVADPFQAAESRLPPSPCPFAAYTYSQFLNH